MPFTMIPSLAFLSCLSLIAAEARAIHDCGGTPQFPEAPLPFAGQTGFTETAPNRVGTDPFAQCFLSSGENLGGATVSTSGLVSLTMFTDAPSMDVYFGGLTTYFVPGTEMACGVVDCFVPPLNIGEAVSVSDTTISQLSGGVLTNFPLAQGGRPRAAAMHAACADSDDDLDIDITTTEICVVTDGVDALECVSGGVHTDFALPGPAVAAYSWTNGLVGAGQSSVAGVVVIVDTPTPRALVITNQTITQDVAMPGTMTGDLVPPPGTGPGFTVLTIGGPFTIALVPPSFVVSVVRFQECDPDQNNGGVAVNDFDCFTGANLGGGFIPGSMAAASAGWAPGGAFCGSTDKQASGSGLGGDPTVEFTVGLAVPSMSRVGATAAAAVMLLAVILALGRSRRGGLPGPSH
jgi:hypothetical protein